MTQVQADIIKKNIIIIDIIKAKKRFSNRGEALNYILENINKKSIETDFGKEK